jgi:hypothetical protein
MRVVSCVRAGLPVWVYEARRMPIDTLGRRAAGVGWRLGARERRPGEILVKALVNGPGRGKPMGAASGSVP